MKEYPKLYTRNTNGSINVWWARVDGNSYVTCYGQIDGKIQETLPIFCEAKNVGKSNETTPERQAESDIKNLYTKQKRLNYFEDINDIDTGFLEPQLAKPNADYADDVKWEDGIIFDDKLNGWAFFATAEGVFSRKNKRYNCIPHIDEEFAKIFKKYPNAYLQGELFNPVHVEELEKLAELVSVGRKLEDMTPELLADSKRIVQAHLYDGYGMLGTTINTPGLERRVALKELIHDKFDYLYLVNYDIVYSFEEAEKKKLEYIEKGGEGKISRNPHAPYQHKRTKDLLKWKKEEDAEFEVISVEQGTGNWTGAAKFAWCKLTGCKKADKFKTNIDGSQERNKEIFKNRADYIGKWITVRYESLSTYGVPLKPYTNMIIRSEVEG